MPADIPSNFPDFDNSNLDALLIDPVVREILKEVDKLNASDDGLDYEKARVATADLDYKWAEELDLMNELASLTGHVDYFVRTDEYPNGKIFSTFLDEAEVRSEGFTFVPVDEKLYYDESVDPTDERIIHKIALLFKTIRRNDDNDIIEEMSVTVSPDKLMALSFEYSMSFDQAQEILKYYCPHIIKEIDDILDSQQFPDEIAASFLLGEKVWDLSPLGSDEIKVARAINVYLDCMLNFDSLPYAAFFNGDAIHIGKNMELTGINVECTAATLITINKLCFVRPTPLEGGEESSNDLEHLVTAHVDCLIHDDDKSVPPMWMLMPVVNLEYATSLRAQFAASDEDVANDDQQPL